MSLLYNLFYPKILNKHTKNNLVLPHITSHLEGINARDLRRSQWSRTHRKVSIRHVHFRTHKNIHSLMSCDKT